VVAWLRRRRREVATAALGVGIVVLAAGEEAAGKDTAAVQRTVR
jgi:hypothetical protein